MKGFYAFAKKEFLQIFRSGKLVLLALAAALFGIMNPALAKLTPWMLENLSGSMEESGLTVTTLEVSVFSSWTQFYKNAPMMLVIFLLMFAGTVTTELQKKTLVNMVTKGLARWKILGAKGMLAVISWSGCYWLMFGVTWGYNRYFWGDEPVQHPVLAAGGLYLLGLWLLVLTVFGSVFVKSGTAAMAVGGGGFLLSYLLGLLPALREFVPTYLTNTAGLLNGANTPRDFCPAVWITLALTALAAAAGVIGFNRKEL